MEILLVLLLLVGIAIFALNSSRSRPTKTRSRDPKSFQRTSHQPPPFDEISAKQTHGQPVLHGAAYIVDGDTLVIAKTQIRLFGVDAPEMNHPYGKSAKWALVSLCKGQLIRAEVAAQDSHGRMVAKCYLQDGRDLSAEMVKLGLAIDWTKFSGGQYRGLEVADARKKMWLADARQMGRMHVWEQYDAKNASRAKAQ